MSVGYVLESYPSAPDGALVEEILAHERAGVSLALFSLSPPGSASGARSDGRVRAPVSCLVPRSGGPTESWSVLTIAAPELADRVRRRGITHLHARSRGVSLVVARLAARLAGVGYSAAVGADDLGAEGLGPEALRAALAEARDVVVASESVLGRLRELLGPSADRARRVYAGVDAAHLAYREPIGRPPTVIAAGRLVEGSGFAELIDACAVLACGGRPVNCRIVGSGPLEEDLRHHIAAHGLDDRVRLVAPRPDGGLAEEVADAAVLAAPHVEHPVGGAEPPTPVLRAMALGTPVVATRVPGVGEAVRDGETGSVVAPGDPAALAAAIERLFADPERRVRLARAARRLVEEEFDADRQAASVRLGFPEKAL